MKKLSLLIFPLVLVVMISGCEYFLPQSESSPDEIPVQFIEEVELRYGQEIALDEGRLKLLFSTVVDDSRCPMRALCETSGNAQIRIQAATPRINGFVVLNTNEEDHIKYQHKDTFEGYEVELLQLLPEDIQRHNSVAHKEYIARLVIRRN